MVELKNVARGRLQIVTAGSPHPVRGASTVLFYQYIEALRDAGYVLRHLVLFDPSNDDPVLFAEYRAAIGEKVEIVAHHLASSCGPRGLTRYVRAPELPVGVGDAMRAFRPDATVCFDIICAAALAQVAGTGPRIVWLGDLYFQSSWYNALYDARESRKGWWRLPLNLISSVAWKRFYRDALATAAGVIVSSKSSEAVLGKMGIRSTYLPYPWPEPKASGESLPAMPDDKPTFFFFGSLSGLGSRSALDFFLRDVYPRMFSEWGAGGFKVLIAGARELPPWARAAIEVRREIEFLGFVDDLGVLARRCHAIIAPIEVPVGNRSRILTAMSMGCLTIAHRNTALGNPDLVSGENCLLARTAAEFMGHMSYAVSNRPAAARLGGNARLTYLEHFSPVNATRRLIDKVACIILLHGNVLKKEGDI